jgi:hypothetical protein
MVFQSMPVFAFGMVFTDWRLTGPALAAMPCAIGGASLTLAALRQAWRWPLPLIGGWAGLYVGGITTIIAVT